MNRTTTARPASRRARLSLPFRTLLAASLLAAFIAPGCNKTPSAAKPSQSAAAATSPPGRDDLPADIAPVVAEIDAALAAEHKRAGVRVAPEADDATYLRRLHLDLVGKLPSPAEVKAFTTDTAPDKRARLAAKLVKHPEYAKRWTEYFDQLLNRAIPGKSPGLDRLEQRRWLHRQLASDAGWDKLVHALLTAEGRNSEGGRPRPDEWELPDKPEAADGEINGAVNWLLRGTRQPENLAGATSRLFLGVQIQCAQCHDHPTETWKQQDFKSFTAAFLSAQARRVDRGKTMGVRRFEVEDTESKPRRRRRQLRKHGLEGVTPAALDGTALDSATAGKPSRVALADWIVSPQNPWFAKAFVNRMWAELLGRGFTDPVDDWRKEQEVAAPAVFDAVTRDFVASGYDIRRLLRVIVASNAYQRAAVGGAGQEQPVLWERFRLRPMSAAQLLDAIVGASGLEPVLQDVVGERLSRVKLRLRRQMTFTFDVDEESGDDAFTGTVPQALMLLNGVLTSAGSTPLEGSAVGEAVQAGGAPDAVISQLYLAALSRQPEPAELTHWRSYVADAPPVQGAKRARGGGPVGRVYRRRRLRDAGPTEAAYADIFWALLNSSEFFFIH